MFVFLWFDSLFVQFVTIGVVVNYLKGSFVSLPGHFQHCEIMFHNHRFGDA